MAKTKSKELKKTELLFMRITKVEKKEIELLVEDHNFANNTHFFRTAVNNLKKDLLIKSKV